MALDMKFREDLCAKLENALGSRLTAEAAVAIRELEAENARLRDVLEYVEAYMRDSCVLPEPVCRAVDKALKAP